MSLDLALIRAAAASELRAKHRGRAHGAGGRAGGKRQSEWGRVSAAPARTQHRSRSLRVHAVAGSQSDAADTRTVQTERAADPRGRIRDSGAALEGALAPIVHGRLELNLVVGCRGALIAGSPLARGLPPPPGSRRHLRRRRATPRSASRHARHVRHESDGVPAVWAERAGRQRARIAIRGAGQRKG